MGNHNCCFPLFSASSLVSNLQQHSAFETVGKNSDWLVLDQGSAGCGLTIVLTLHEASNLEGTIQWIRSNRDLLRNVLISTPRDSGQSQPLWSSPPARRLFDAIGSLQNLEVLLLHEIGDGTSNAIPIQLLAGVLKKQHLNLKQVYLVGSFEGEESDCSEFAKNLRQQQKLQSFALYGEGSTGFCLDRILTSVSQLPTLKCLYFHANMPTAVITDTMVQVGNMSQLESLTVHSCNIHSHNVVALANALQNSHRLKELTIFEAFEMFQHKGPSSVQALCDLLRTTQSIWNLQVWFGFAESEILNHFAKALRENQTVTNFETALIWTAYAEDTAKAFCDMLRTKNTRLTNLVLKGYKGPWRLPIYFFIRLNQLGRHRFVAEYDEISPQEWIEKLTNIPPLCPPDGDAENSSNAVALAAMEDEPSDKDWFAISWIYTFLRINPSLCSEGLAHHVA
jgi:hypothetical protein